MTEGGLEGPPHCVSVGGWAKVGRNCLYVIDIILIYLSVVDQEKEDKDSHERGSGDRGGKQADRRIDIQPAEDEDGKKCHLKKNP